MTLVVALAQPAQACDVCGCSIGGNYLGVVPEFNRHFVSARYGMRSFWVSHPESEGFTQEHSQTADIALRLYPHQRFQVMVIAPWQFIQPASDRRFSGAGDLSVLVNWIPLRDAGQTWRKTLTVGGGLKAPTGSFRMEDAEGLPYSVLHQPGSGSWDYIANAQYMMRRGDWGLTADAVYRHNTTNPDGYRFGHRLSGSVKAFYWKKIGQTGAALLPSAGFFADCAAKDVGHGALQQLTGGDSLLGLVGLDLFTRNFSAGVNFQTPLAERLADGRARSGARWMFSINYFF